MHELNVSEIYGALGQEAKVDIVWTESPRSSRLCVEVASTETAWEKGLAERDDITTRTGMLFVFPERRLQPFTGEPCKMPLLIYYLQWVGLSDDETAFVARVVGSDFLFPGNPRFSWPRTWIDAALETAIPENWDPRPTGEYVSVLRTPTAPCDTSPSSTNE